MFVVCAALQHTDRKKEKKLLMRDKFDSFHLRCNYHRGLINLQKRTITSFKLVREFRTFPNVGAAMLTPAFTATGNNPIETE